ncbi:Atu1372/SO_1960 family protein [Sphingobacterium sp. UME9]|uniref:Atu1372/SO_1960 family protein n=1 Tax=Sphingobacterium sp. UME9 TaxID=1862316 RepID=UPI0015FF0873|nr:Atu1372/SO_1960 family protein [Sphingobacterium sp. UME9]MBB1643024.1 repressor [Sphingobacterium sp. UME9]
MNRIFLAFTFLLILVLTDRSLAMQKQANILILIHSDEGGTYEIAKEVAKGIENNGNTKAIIKRVKFIDNPKLNHIPVANVSELSSYDGIAFGSPVYFGNISTAMSEFFAQTTTLWSKHELEGMPAMVFMSAGSGAGRELAMQSFMNMLAVHGMVLVPNGIRGNEKLDKSIPQGNTVLGTTSLASLKNVARPSDGERLLASEQGKYFSKVAIALKGTFGKKSVKTPEVATKDINQILKEKHITLPKVPAPAGNYLPYVRSGNLVFINQYALKDGKLINPGKIGVEVTEEQVKEATRITMLNIIAVLSDAVDGDLNKVKKCVQLVGIFNASEQFSDHAKLMNAASDLTVEIFGDQGKHARATLGASSIPGNSSVEIQAIFEIE